MQKRDGNNGDNGTGGSGANNAPYDDDVYFIGDRMFTKTKLGLDEVQVRAYIDEIISERDALQKRQEHLSALAELAEKTVIEANNLAQQMKQKAVEQAKADAEKVKVKAEQDAEQYIKEKKAEATTLAEKEAESIRAEALKQAELKREEQMNALRAEAKDLTQKVQADLLASLDSIRQNIISLEPDLEEIASFNYQTSVPVTAAQSKAAIAEPGEKGSAIDHIPWLEVEVLPPVDIGKIMDLISRLEELPEVKTTDLLPEMPNPLIRVFLNESAPLGELLRTLPQVESVTEAPMGITSEESKERIQIVLTKNNNIKDKEDKKESRTPAAL
jgi:cell division septum initiation protein DivIVA